MAWASECPDVKNYKRQLNPVWHMMLYSCTDMAAVDVKRLIAVNWDNVEVGRCDMQPLDVELLRSMLQPRPLSPAQTTRMRRFQSMLSSTSESSRHSSGSHVYPCHVSSVFSGCRPWMLCFRQQKPTLIRRQTTCLSRPGRAVVCIQGLHLGPSLV